jgi:hypothetical protein
MPWSPQFFILYVLGFDVTVVFLKPVAMDIEVLDRKKLPNNLTQ